MSVQPCERVLVVDDNPDMLATLRDLIEIAGATAATATSPEEADRVLAQGFEPSVILVDVRLGRGERGDELAHRMRADPRFAGVPIILMSGDIHELRRVADQVGADATVEKPFDVDRLFEMLSDMCGEA
jgi:CheY-like chemotaxis protein